MTEETIMIDGVDVSECVYFYEEVDKHSVNIHEVEYCSYYDNQCCENDCDYKQLQRKTAECEKLKKQYNCYACGNCNGKEDYRNLERHSLKTRESFEKLLKRNQELEKAINETLGILCNITITALPIEQKFATSVCLLQQTLKDCEE